MLRAATGAEALETLESSLPQLMLLDLQLPDMSGLEILRQVQSRSLPVGVVVITAHGSVDLAVESMRSGAIDFLEKPFDRQRLLVTLNRALEHVRLRHLVRDFEDSIGRTAFHGFLGSSLAMQKVYDLIEAVAPSRASVFITGESGTGKELCAEAIHQAGTRHDGPFVVLNCAAIPHELMESEIFGHVKGAFTGATSDRRGAASLADGGTLFLDEIGELPMDLQSKLLRFLQTGTFQRVGASRTETVDVRIVCATNRDPRREVREGRFREDLFFRLFVVPIHLPPLRERGDDVVLIADALLERIAGEEGKTFERFADETLALLRRHDWPGNVRELENTLRNAVVLHNGVELLPTHLPAPLAAMAGNHASSAAGTAAAVAVNVPPVPAQATSNGAATAPGGVGEAIRPLADVEREAIENAIAICDGNVPRAAALLGVAASTIYRKKQAWSPAH
jgi:DNA-binding NtrC family response regulator